MEISAVAIPGGEGIEAAQIGYVVWSISPVCGSAASFEAT